MSLIPRRLLVLGLAATVLSGGCLSPTLPLPPPSAPEAVQVSDTQYRLSGFIPEPGNVYARNEETGLIFGQLALDREYSFLMEAQPGDFVSLWYTSGTELSGSYQFIVDEDRVRLDRLTEAGSPDGS